MTEHKNGPPAPILPGRVRRLFRNIAFALHRQAGFGQKPGVKRMFRNLAVAAIPSMRHLDTPRRLRQLTEIGFVPRTIYDIGAASGEWARLAHWFWPTAAIIGFEPNAGRVPDLERTASEIPKFRYYRAFLGPAAGQIRYTDHDDQTSLLSRDRDGGGSVTAPMIVLDELMAQGEIPAPEFMKLDVQGFELEVLKGGAHALRTCRGVLMEATLIPFFDGMPPVADVMRFMGDHGFALYDVMGFFRRGSDDALIQMDLLFLTRDDALRRSGLS
jgi:FkbM family methyltransferase